MTKSNYVILSAFQKCLCGKDDVESANDATRIVGGKESGRNKHPWQANYLLKLLPPPSISGFFAEKRRESLVWGKPYIKVFSQI